MGGSPRAGVCTPPVLASAIHGQPRTVRKTLHGFARGYIRIHAPSRTSIHCLHPSNPAREGQEHTAQRRCTAAQHKCTALTPCGARSCRCSCRCFGCKSKKWGQRIVCAEGCAYACSPPSKTMDGFAHGRRLPWMAPPPTGGGEHACACPSARPKRCSPRFSALRALAGNGRRGRWHGAWMTPRRCARN